MNKIAAIATTTVLAAGGLTGLAGLTVTADAAPGAVAGQAVRAALHASEVGDDHGRHSTHPEPGDDRGNHAEPGDDHGNHAEPGDDHGTHAEPGDDHGGDDSGSGHGGHGSDD